MPVQTGNLGTCGMVEDSDGVIAAAADNAPTVELDARDSLLMSRKSLEACSVVDVPNFDVTIPRSRHDLILVNLNGVDGSLVAFQGHEQLVWIDSLDVATSNSSFSCQRRNLRNVDDISWKLRGSLMTKLRVVLVGGFQFVSTPDFNKLVFRACD